MRLRYTTDKSQSEYGDAESVIVAVTFPEEGDELFVTIELCNKQETPFIESGSLIFPAMGKVDYRIGRPGGVIDPKTQIRTCANHSLFCLEQEVTVLGEQGCLSICSLDAPLFGIGSTGIYEYHKEFGMDRKPSLYFNLFNNMWGTNFPQWIGGSFRYRFVLRGCTEQEAESAYEWAARISGKAVDILPGNVTLPQGMELVHMELEDNVLYVMLRDLTGISEMRQIYVEGAEIASVDLLHRPAGETGSGCMSFGVRPYGIHVFALQRRQ